MENTADSRREFSRSDLMDVASHSTDDHELSLRLEIAERHLKDNMQYLLDSLASTKLSTPILEKYFELLAEAKQQGKVFALPTELAAYETNLRQLADDLKEEVVEKRRAYIAKKAAALRLKKLTHTPGTPENLAAIAAEKLKAAISSTRTDEQAFVEKIAAFSANTPENAAILESLDREERELAKSERQLSVEKIASDRERIQRAIVFLETAQLKREGVSLDVLASLLTDPSEVLYYETTPSEGAATAETDTSKPHLFNVPEAITTCYITMAR